MKIFSKSVFLIFISFLFPFHLGAGEIEVELFFPRSHFQLNQAGEYWDASFPGCGIYPRIGAPKIPSRPVYICLPPGTVPRKVTVIAEEKKELPGRYLLSPVQNPWPGAPPALPDPRVYDNDQPYPAARVEITGWGDKSGHRIASLIVNPLEYIPRERKIYLSTMIRLSLSWEEKPGLRKAIKPLVSNQNSAVKRLVENPGDLIILYPPGEKIRLSPEPVDYLIITDSSLESQFQTLVAHKETRGMSVEVTTTDRVYADYSGDDNQEKIRECIRDYYQNRGTKWVLIGGMPGLVPMRLARLNAGCSGWQNVPTDLYYACLDGNWNEDGDGYYGEVEDHPDIYPELMVSRAPVDTAFEAQTFAEKVVAHETGSADHDRVLLLSEAFTSAPKNSETLQGLFPSGWEKKRLYENYAPHGAEEATRESVLAALHQGYGFINHIGHGTWDKLCTGAGNSEIYGSDFAALTNGPHSVIFTQGCNTANPDYDNVARQFLLNPAGGGVAYIGSTRTATTWSINLNQGFIEGLYQVPIYRVGSALNYARDKIAALAAYCEYYLYDPVAMNIFGDPESAYAHRVFFTLEIDDSSGGDGDGCLEPGESAEITVTISNFWGDAEGLTVELSDDSPELDIPVSESSLGDVAYASRTDNSCAPFQVSLDPSAPESYQIELGVNISSTNGYFETEQYWLRRLPVHVDWRNQTGPEDGTPEYPYNTIQEGIDTAPDNALIFVAGGTYHENISLKSWITLRGEDPETTIIDGGNTDSVVTIEALTCCTLENFTITHGFRPSYEYGGGIYCHYGSNLRIDNCAIVDNQAHSGGGIYLYRASGTVFNCLIRGNQATYAGGGVNCGWGSDMNFERDIVAFNAAEKGGGMYIKGTADIVHCDIVGNTATSSGGGIDFFTGNALIRNSIVSGNDRYGISGELDCYYFTVRYSDVGVNTFSNINANSGKYTVTGLLSVDPRLVDPEGGDFNLQSTSPCRDTAEDIGEPYFGDGPDMGALEYSTITPTPSSSATPSPSVTPSLTPTPTASPSPPPSPTPTPMATSTPVPSVAPTPPVGPSVTPTQSMTPTPSVTPTPSMTPAPSVTPTPTPTPTLTATPTPSSTPTSSPSPTLSSTPTPSPSSTFPAPSPTSTDHCPLPIIASGDFDGDGTSDIAVFREISGLWAVRGVTRVYFGLASDIPAPGDYDGDGTTDIGVFREDFGLWAIRGVTRAYFGSSDDRAVPGDYDGDGCCDVGIFREGSGLWALRGKTRVYFGSSNDRPIPGDFDGDGTKEIGIFRGGSGLWALKNISRVYFGSSGDEAVPGNYDGDATWEVGIFRPSSGLWAIRGITRSYFGSASDHPVPADFDGDRIDNIGIFRDTSGLWAVRGVTRVYFGASGDISVAR